MTCFDLSKLNLPPERILNATVTDVRRWHWGQPASILSNSRSSK